MSSSASRWTRPATPGLVAALAAVVLSATLAAAPARAAGTAPLLALVAADAFASSAGGRLVTIDGAFDFDDLVQISFPAAGALVVQGAHFARFDVDGTVGEGTSALVADGVVAADIPSVLAASGPTSSPARVVQVAPSRISVVLPPSFVAGPASVMLFAIHENEPFVTNAIDLVLP